MTAMRFMRVVVLLAILILSAQIVCAKSKSTSGSTRPHKDIYGNRYKKSENLFKDRDKNGVRNIYQKMDRQQIRKRKIRR